MTIRLPVRLVAGIGAAAVASLALAAQSPDSGDRTRFYVAGAGLQLAADGLALPAPTGAEAATFTPVPAPGLRSVLSDDHATDASSIDSNGWRFERGVRKASYPQLPRGAAPLAAAEAFAYGLDAVVLTPTSDDVGELGSLLRFLRAQNQPQWKPLANIGVVDDGSPAMGGALNALTSRNLLYRVIPKPQRHFDLIVRPGSTDFPRDVVAHPSDFAARVREKLGDAKPLVRVSGTSTAVVRLVGNDPFERLFVLSYSRNHLQSGVRISLRDRYQPIAQAFYRVQAGGRLTDIGQVEQRTEFTLPTFSTIAIIDLVPTR